MEPAELGARDRAFLHWQAIIQSGIAELLPHKVQPRRVRADRVLAPRPDKAPGEDSVAGDDSSMSGWSDQSTSGDSVGLRVHFEDAAPRLRRPKELRPPPEEPAQPPPELPGDPAPVLPPHPPPPPPEQPVVGLPAPPGCPVLGSKNILMLCLQGAGVGVEAEGEAEVLLPSTVIHGCHDGGGPTWSQLVETEPEWHQRLPRYTGELRSLRWHADKDMQARPDGPHSSSEERWSCLWPCVCLGAQRLRRRSCCPSWLLSVL
jgi:hypothetical protein